MFVAGSQSLHEERLYLHTDKIDKRLFIPYFFPYKMEVFPYQINSNYLDLSYKADLDLGLFWKGIPYLLAEF